MSIVFNKGVKVLEVLQKHLLNITKANGFNIAIKNCIIYDVLRFEKLKNELQLPAVLLTAEEIFEELTNDEYRSVMTVQAFVEYKPENQNNGVVTDYSKIRSAIAEQLNTNECLGLSYVEKAYVSSAQHPLYLIDRSTFSFLMTIDIQYYFCSSDP